MSAEELRKLTHLVESFLTEAQNYNDMFNDARKALSVVGDETITNSYEKVIADMISRSKAVLRKSDRIVWFLREWKIGLLIYMTDKLPEAKEILVPLVNKLIADTAKRGGYEPRNRQTYLEVYGTGTNYLQRLGHFLSLPIPEIQNYQYGFKPANEVMFDFSSMEETWKATAKQLIPYDPDDGKIILKFADGYFWQDLNREYCKAEGGAMGHCGNSAAYKQGDTVLSLRQMVIRGDEKYVRPCLTFILQKDGMLGEMKGRANNKPEQKYHKYIVELLKQDYIEGIRGGGYAAEKNFSLSDLDDEVREELIEKKPSLGSLLDVYRTYGSGSKLFQEKLADAIYNTPLDYYSIDGDTVTLQKWDDFEDFVRSINDEVLEYYVGLYNEDSTVMYDTLQEEITGEDIYDLIDGLSTENYISLMRDMGIKPARHNDAIAYRKTVNDAVESFYKDEQYLEKLLDAMNSVLERNSKIGLEFKNKVLDIIKKYIETGWNFEVYDVTLVLNENDLTEEVTLRTNMTNYVEIISADPEDDHEYAYQKYRVYDDGWGGVDWYGTNDMRKEAKLPSEYSRKEQSELNKAIGSTSALDKIDFRIFSKEFADKLGL